MLMQKAIRKKLLVFAASFICMFTLQPYTFAATAGTNNSSQLGDFVVDSKITPSIASFNTSSPEDIKVTLKGSLAAIKNGNSLLKSSTDYTISGNVVTIKKSYLSTFFGTFRQDLKLVFTLTSGNVALTVKPVYPDSTINPAAASYDFSNPADVKVTLNLKDNSFIAIKSANAALFLGTDYTVSGNDVTINKSFFEYYFNRFGKTLNLTFDLSKGTDPVLSVTPLNINACVYPSTANYNVAASGDLQLVTDLKGTYLTGIKNGSSALVRYIDYTLLNNTVTIKKDYLTKALKDGNINLSFSFSSGKDSVVNIVSGSVSDSTLANYIEFFNTASPKDVTVGANFNGNTLKSVFNGSTELRKSDYAVSGNTITIKSGYLSYYFGLHTNTFLNLTLKFSAGNSRDLVINPVLPSSILEKPTDSYDLSKPVNFDVKLNPGSNSLLAVKNGADALVLGKDYTVNGNVVSINKDYLTYYFNIYSDELKLAFDFSAGSDPVLTLTPAYSVAPSVDPSDVLFNISDPADCKFTMKANGANLLGILNGSAVLLPSCDYSVSGDTVSISKNYLSYFFERSSKALTLTFVYDSGSRVSVIVKPYTSVNSSISPVRAIFDLAKPKDVSVTMTPNTNTLKAIKNGSTVLVPGTDYTVSGNTVTIKQEYLNFYFFRLNNSVKLVFDFSSGKDPSITIKTK